MSFQSCSSSYRVKVSTSPLAIAVKGRRRTIAENVGLECDEILRLCQVVFALGMSESSLTIRDFFLAMFLFTAMVLAVANIYGFKKASYRVMITRC